MTRRKDLNALSQFVRTGQAMQRDVDLILAPTKTRRQPRQLDGKRVVKIRIVADCEEDADQARALVEQLLARLECRMQAPREGQNPKYADEQKWMSYGDFVLPGKGKRKQ